MDPGLMQMHLKQNSEDLQEYMRGLDAWEDDMKKRDQLLKKQKPILKKAIPPVRGQAASSSKKQHHVPSKKGATTTRTNPAATQPDRIKSFDYNAWNRFDVDAACEDTPSNSSSEEDEEIEESEREEEDKRKKMAELEKERGNQLFKEGKYKAAVERYTKAVNLNPTSHILPANRAMALIKLQQYAAAESDCNTSIALEENYLKSWQRRATARVKLGKLHEALEDYRQVLKMSPSSEATSLEIKKLEEQIAKQGSAELRSKAVEKDPRAVYPVKRPPHLRSEKPLVRIKIEEIGGNVAVENEKNIDDSSFETLKDKELTTTTKEEDMGYPVKIGVESTTVDGGTTPGIPSSSIEFMSQWKSLKSNKQILAQYFQSIPPQKYPTLLNQSLETSVFSDILTILLQNFTSISESLMDSLHWLTQVPRFNVAVMFLSKADKGKLTAIFGSLLTSTADEPEKVHHLARQYSVKL